jgi:hypothetical protein
VKVEHEKEKITMSQKYQKYGQCFKCNNEDLENRVGLLVLGSGAASLFDHGTADTPEREALNRRRAY